jgi:hypothetical protein
MKLMIACTAAAGNMAKCETTGTSKALSKTIWLGLSTADMMCSREVKQCRKMDLGATYHIWARPSKNQGWSSRQLLSSISNLHCITTRGYCDKTSTRCMQDGGAMIICRYVATCMFLPALNHACLRTPRCC